MVFFVFRSLAVLSATTSRPAMVYPTVLSILALLISAAYAKPLSTSHVSTKRDMVVHERRDSMPSGFVHLGAAPEDQVLNLKFALTQSNFSGLESELYAISTPGSDRYRQFLSKEHVSTYHLTCTPNTFTNYMFSMFGRLRRDRSNPSSPPSPSTLSTFNNWLTSHNLTSTPFSPAGDWHSVNMTVSQANDVLGAEFATFRHEETGVEAVRTMQYGVPGGLGGVVGFVHPTVA